MASVMAIALGSFARNFAKASLRNLGGIVRSMFKPKKNEATMADLVNDYFKRFYPPNLDPSRFRYASVGLEYEDRSHRWTVELPQQMA